MTFALDYIEDFIILPNLGKLFQTVLGQDLSHILLCLNDTVEACVLGLNVTGLPSTDSALNLDVCDL